ncbi:MAG: hypothetical protein FJ145_18980 [Deltaproteobacteria bacterium]|nr:hypothetical protein [Deltaproteobacteria bacterium]
MKISSVKLNNRKKLFEIKTAKRLLSFPYVKAELTPTAEDPIVRVYVDKEIAKEGFTYQLASGKTATIHVEQVLEYNQDPSYLRDLLIYRLTLEAQKRVAKSRLAKREMVRRLRTSATQFYRLLDQTNYDKSVDQLIALLQILDCEVDLVVRAKSA